MNVKSINKKKTDKKKIKFFNNVFRYKELLFMLAVPAVYLIINNYLPMIGIIIAFKDYRFDLGVFGSAWSGLDNFRYLLATQDAWIITRNTLGFNLIFIALDILIPVTLAVLFNELRGKFKAKIYQTVMLFPYFLSMILVSYLIYALLSPANGFVNMRVLPALGIEPVRWYLEVKAWPFILPMTHVWKTAGYTTIMYLASITSIDPVYYEAIAIDGGGKWKQIRYITLPFLQPLIIILALLAVGRIFTSDFGLFYQVPMNSGALFRVTNVIDTYVYRALLQTNDIGMASAAGFYKAVMGFALVMISNAVIRRINPEWALI